jgi:hypothetical protein
MSSNIFTEDKLLVSESEQAVDKLLYSPMMPSLCDGSPVIISSDEIFDREYETRTYQLSHSAEENLTQLATPARTSGKQVHARQSKFKYLPTIEECFYETSTRKKGDELNKELATVNSSTMDILNEAWDISTFFGAGGEYGGYRNSANTVLDEEHNASELNIDFIKVMIKEKLRALKEVAPITGTNLSSVDFVFTSGISDLIYDFDSNSVSNVSKLKELFPNLRFVEANNRFKTASKEFMSLSFRSHLALHRSALPALTERERNGMSNKMKSKYEYCTAAINVKRYGAVQFVELQS